MTMSLMYHTYGRHTYVCEENGKRKQHRDFAGGDYQPLVWQSLTCLWKSGWNPEFSRAYGRTYNHELRFAFMWTPGRSRR